MKDVLDQLRARGYWQARLLPSVEKANRWTDPLVIAPQLRELAVNFRGWDYPHVDLREQPAIEADRTWQQTHWQHFHELWCVFKSGQFLHVAGMRTDYGATPPLSVMEEVQEGTPMLGVGDTVFRMTEFVHFSARYAEFVCPGETLNAQMIVGGLQGRRLVIDDPSRGATSVEYVCRGSEPFEATITIRVGMSQPELAQVARDLAARLCVRFGFRASDLMLEGWQAQLIYYPPA